MSKHPGSVWIDQNFDTLPKNQWIAVDENGLVEHDSDFKTLIKKLESRGIDLSNVSLTFVPEGVYQ